MTRDKIIFVISFAFLGLLAAYLFSHKAGPITINTNLPEEKVEAPIVVPVGEEALPPSQGKIAVPVQLNTRSMIVEFLKPGGFVNIRFTSKANIGLNPLSVILLRDVKVLGIGKDSEGRKFADKNAFYRSNNPVEILLDLTPAEAEILSYAEMSGSIHFEISQGKTADGNDELAQMLMQSKSDYNFNSILISYMIESLFPKSNVKVIATGNGYIISGTVVNEEMGEKIIKVLHMLSPSAEVGSNVVNLMEPTKFVEVLVATKNLKVNQNLNNKDYSWTRVSTENLNPDLIVRSVEAENWLDGSTVKKDLLAGSKISKNDIMWSRDTQETDHPVVLSVQAGKRSVELEQSSRLPIAQFLGPGVFVDVKLSSRADVGFLPINFILLKNIRVLAVEQGSGGGGKQNAILQIFLEMSPEEAEIFSYAIISGAVSLELAGTDKSDIHQSLANELLQSKSAGDFQSVLVTYMVKLIFPGIRVGVVSTPRGFIVQGQVPDPQMADKIMEIFTKLIPAKDQAIINMMEVKPQQVLLAVRVYEVSKNVISRFGMNWSTLIQAGSDMLAFGATLPAIATTDANYFLNGKAVSGNFTLSAFLDMLEEDVDNKVLAQPNLTTVSGETGHFFAGGEFPVLIPQGGNLIGTVTVEYKKYGVLLDFTPVVDLSGLITLHVVPEVSDIDRRNSVILSGFVIPGLRTRRVDTTVKLWSGQSYLIAGMYLDDMNDRNESLYGLDKVPLLGSMFGSNRYEDRRMELLIIITPYLIEDQGGAPTEDICIDPNTSAGYSLCQPQFVPTPWDTSGVFDYSSPDCSEVECESLEYSGD